MFCDVGDVEVECEDRKQSCAMRSREGRCRHADSDAINLGSQKEKKNKSGFAVQF
jgi:hypothetical protein